MYWVRLLPVNNRLLKSMVLRKEEVLSKYFGSGKITIIIVNFSYNYICLYSSLLV